MGQTTVAWQFNIDRGPDLLMVHVPHQTEPAVEFLAEELWRVLENHFTYRMVLDFDPRTVFRSALVGQLVLLHKRIANHDGVLRLCGMSPGNLAVLETCQLRGRIPCYLTRQDAIHGVTPNKPR